MTPTTTSTPDLLLAKPSVYMYRSHKLFQLIRDDSVPFEDTCGGGAGSETVLTTKLGFGE